VSITLLKRSSRPVRFCPLPESLPLFTQVPGETVWKIAGGSVLEALKAEKWHLWLRFDPLWESTVELIRNFQTVSEGVFSEVHIHYSA
jgi:hypothetical protein